MRVSDSFMTSSTSSIMAFITFYAHAKEGTFLSSIFKIVRSSRRFLPNLDTMSTTLHLPLYTASSEFSQITTRLRCILNRNQCPDGLTHHGGFECAFFPEVHDQNWQVIFHAQRKSRHIHHFEVLCNGLLETQRGVALCIRVFLGVAVVNSVNLGRLDNDLGFDFFGPQ